MKTNVPKILFFIDGPVPNQANHTAANALRADGAQVMFRNARFDDSAMETCDGVAGPAIPKRYLTVATAEKAIEEYKQRLAKPTDGNGKTVNESFTDNLGSHTMPNPATVPQAAPLRPAAVPAAPAASTSTSQAPPPPPSGFAPPQQ